MNEQHWFVPGIPGPPCSPLARYRTAQPLRAVGAYVQRLTRPGDLVVDLFCQGPTVVREAAAAGRRALGLSVNPLLLVAARLGLRQPSPAALNAAFTRLADSPKGDVPLRRYLASLYRSSCPTCGAPGTAEWFAWDRDANRPFRKTVRCSRCAGVQEGATDDEDLLAARRVQPRGLAYYYALDRAAPPDHPARERAAELVALYTPRNLSALMDLSMRLERLEADEETKLALTGVLADCFDLCSSLDPYDEERPRPRALRVPSRYLERNVWLCFEEQFSRLQAVSSLPLPDLALNEVEGLGEEGGPGGIVRAPSPLNRIGEEGPLPLETDVAALVRGAAAGYALADRPAREVGEIVPPASAALIFADPPRPDGVFWALSALWAAWLWDSPAAHALRPFLRRRRFDWDWHWDVLRAALEAAGPLLTAGGHLVTLFSDPDTTLLESVCLAASAADYALEGWGYCPEAGYRLVWRLQIANRKLQIGKSANQQISKSPISNVEMLERELMAVAQGAVVSAVRERGEPTGWTYLHVSVYTTLVERGLLARVAALPEGDPPPLSFVADAVRRACQAAPLVQLAAPEGVGETLWWLAEPGRAVPVVSEVEPPLAERVESLVRDLFIQQPVWGLEELVDAVYARFSGPLTPNLALVRSCIASYSAQEGEILRLRPEDDPQRRAAELKALRDNLAQLGQRLGFRVKGGGGGWDVRWLEEKREVYGFVISATAALAPYLLARRVADQEVQRCLVLPGGRARLVGLKLQRDPRLAQAIAAGGWQFIKFRHLRRLVAEQELDRHALKTVLGLDPIAEQEAVQIPLF